MLDELLKGSYVWLLSGADIDLADWRHGGVWQVHSTIAAAAFIIACTSRHICTATPAHWNSAR